MSSLDTPSSSSSSSKPSLPTSPTTTTTTLTTTTVAPPLHDDGRDSQPFVPPPGTSYFIHPSSLPYSSTSPGIGGLLKSTSSDFQVTEVSPPPPDSKPGYWWVTLTRSGLSTLEVQQHYASKLDLASHKDVGISGLKDKHAITTQTFSVPSYSKKQKRHLIEEEVRAVSPGTVSSAIPCSKKLRRNYHTSNTFVVTLRGCSPPPSVPGGLAGAVLAVAGQLRGSGVKNYYGPQRFGSHMSGAYRGHALVSEIKGGSGQAAKKAARNAR